MDRSGRRGFFVATLALLALPSSALSQAREKPYRIGYIQTAAPEEQAPLTRAFEEGLRELGYVQQRDYVIEPRYAWGKQERLPALAEELAALNLDVIVTGANPVIAAVKRATVTIPVVMATSRDPVGAGFVASLARPGGNITGLTGDPTPDVQGKRLELLKVVAPGATRVALLWNPLPPGADTYRRAAEEAARTLGINLLAVEARGRDQFGNAFAAMARQGANAVMVLPDPIFFTARREVVKLATEYRLPSVFHARELVESGGLLSYGVSLDYQFRRAAVYVDRILKGARPSDLAVEQAARFELALNLKTARMLGLAIPQALLLQADRVIE